MSNRNNKEIELGEIHKTIWRIANDLRGSVYGLDFKSYILGILFYRFISENLTTYLNRQEQAAGQPDFDYTKLTDKDAEQGREETVVEKGFYILPSQRKGAQPGNAATPTRMRSVFKDIE